MSKVKGASYRLAPTRTTYHKFHSWKRSGGAIRRLIKSKIYCFMGFYLTIAQARNTTRLTQRFAEKTEFPLGKEHIFHDAEIRGYALRVRKNGLRVWTYFDGASKKTLGTINELSEQSARKRVTELKLAKRVGRDLIAEERATAAKARKASEKERLTAGYCFDRYLSLRRV